jgi:hypothetical protein
MTRVRGPVLVAPNTRYYDWDNLWWSQDPRPAEITWLPPRYLTHTSKPVVSMWGTKTSGAEDDKSSLVMPDNSCADQTCVGAGGPHVSVYLRTYETRTLEVTVGDLRTLARRCEGAGGRSSYPQARAADTYIVARTHIYNSMRTHIQQCVDTYIVASGRI